MNYHTIYLYKELEEKLEKYANEGLHLIKASSIFGTFEKVEPQTEYPNIQKTIKPLYKGKGIRLDVYVADEEHTVYNIEMQTYDAKELPQRTRYYQGIMDMESLQQGSEYEKLNQSYIIFICTFDLFRQRSKK
ncbi:MAG: Rpn family recombination-promoting nuclease/putative transposase [Eubacteriales bacterium]